MNTKETMRFLAVASAALFALVNPTQAQVFQTVTNFSTGNFNTNNGWVRSISIIGQNTNSAIADRWTGNDPFNPITDEGETDTILRVIGYTPGVSAVGNSSLVQGGLYSAEDIFPGTNSVRLWRTFTPSVLGASDSVTFFAEWSVIGSLDGSFPQLDSFAFDLRTADNSSSILRLDLTSGINLLPNAYTLQAITDTGSGLATATLIDLGYQALFQVQVQMTGSTYDLNLAQINASTRAVITNYNLVSGGAISSGFSAAQFGLVSLDWELTSGDPQDPGSNYIIVNDFIVSSAVEVIPEAGTWAFGLMLVAILGYRHLANRREASGANASGSAMG